MTDRVHMPQGFAPSGHKVRAFCSCGEVTTPRVDRRRAADALYAEHGRSESICALCDRETRDYAGLRIVRSEDGEVEFLACADERSADCYRLAQEKLHESDKVTWRALGMRPTLRVVR